MTPARQTLCAALVFGVLSAAFSWPLVCDPLGIHVTRQFDMYSLVWLSSAAPSLDSSLTTALSSWPVGETLGRLDSFVLLLVSVLAGPLHTPWLVPALFVLVGPVLSALAAERVAVHHMGARFPWSLLAGAGYAFGGIAATALLEGHVYALLNPWLPLLAGAWLRATGPEGRPQDGLWAGVFWVLCLLTTAYAGLCATLLVGVLGLARNLRTRGVAAAALVAVPAGLLYTWRFVGAGGAVRVDSALTGDVATGMMAAGSAQLGTLAGWTPTVDSTMHSMAPVLGFTVLALALAAPLVLDRNWLPWLVLAGLGGVLSLGPTLRLYAPDGGIPWVLWPLAQMDRGASFLHFPSRLLWVTGLALGLLAARVASVLARSSARRAAPLLGFAVVDVILGTGAPLRSPRIPTTAPSAYAAAPQDRAVLDLMPGFHGQSTDLEWFWNNLSCSHQVHHKRPIATQCIGTTLHQGPRVVVGDWLLDRLLTGTVAGIPELLGGLGFGAVAVHPGLFTSADQHAIVDGLQQALGPPLASSTDGGEWVVVFGVPAVLGTRAQQQARYAQRFPSP